MRGKAQATLALEQVILNIVAERAPITVRGIAYALFVRKLIPSMDVRYTARVSRVTTEMREAETLDWTQIVDDSRAVEHAQTWNDPNELVADTVRAYRRNNWQDQPTIVEVWSEKGTVGGILGPVLDDLGVTFRVMKGFGSFTSVRQAAEDSNDHAGKQTVVLYVGDWDPSGMCMSQKDLPERLKRYGGRWKLKRIAVTRSDIRRLPHFDAKSTDTRYAWFVANYGRHAWELDAMDPRVLRARVRKEIESYIDWSLWDRALRIETREVEVMNEFHRGWADILRGAK